LGYLNWSFFALFGDGGGKFSWDLVLLGHTGSVDPPVSEVAAWSGFLVPPQESAFLLSFLPFPVSFLEPRSWVNGFDWGEVIFFRVE
jgi:hypothetical protein